VHLQLETILGLKALVDGARCYEELARAMMFVVRSLGFSHFAIAHHVGITIGSGNSILLHNYPQAWAEHYRQNDLSHSDPVHRASNVTNAGFHWAALPDMIPMNQQDWRMLETARAQGLGDGFTVPANVPGEASGSVTFINPVGRPISAATALAAQSIGTAAFLAARRMWSLRGAWREMPSVPLTKRQRDVTRWVGQGKSDWEIGRILGISEETAARHVSQGAHRYYVNKRILLVTRALFDGTITFGAILPQFHTKFPV
jgi:LuxR family quorum-sensing system transcriptional regulator CciR